MGNHQYFIPPISYAIITLLILIYDRMAKRKCNESEKAFRLAATWAFFFFVQDCFWGLCDSGIISNQNVFFHASSIFHLSTILTTFFWLNYVLVYLGRKKAIRITFLTIGAAIVVFEFYLVIRNYSSPILFMITDDGQYVIGSMRKISFLNQYIVFLLVGISAFVHSLRSKKKGDKNAKERSSVVCIASLSQIMLGYFQYEFPSMPFFSIGYFFAIFIMHIFVISKDRSLAEKSYFYNAISNSFYSMHIFDLENRRVERCIEPHALTHLIGKSTDIQEMIDRATIGSSCDEYKEMMKEFIDLSTIEQRLEGKNMISQEFVGPHFGWVRMSFIPVEHHEDRLTKVMSITQIIDNEKRQQIELLFTSYNDEMTGVYNRRAFGKELEKIETEGIADDLVFVTLDVNGLKPVNDNLGHAAGDELIIGAAQCITRTFGIYGKVFRTGGDEFCAIINANEKQMQEAKQAFRETCDNWHGKIVKSVSISYGYASKAKDPGLDINALSILSDKRMYDNKAKYYHDKGIDRSKMRGC